MEKKENIQIQQTKNDENTFVDFDVVVRPKISGFIEWLRNNKHSIYRCIKCGHSQGHQIVYCPKCPNKMIYKKGETLEQAFKYEAITNETYYKDRLFDK